MTPYFWVCLQITSLINVELRKNRAQEDATVTWRRLGSLRSLRALTRSFGRWYAIHGEAQPRWTWSSVDVYHWHHSIRPAIGPELFAAAAERLLLDSDWQIVLKWFGFSPFLTFLATVLGTVLLTGACSSRNTHTLLSSPILPRSTGLRPTRLVVAVISKTPLVLLQAFV